MQNTLTKNRGQASIAVVVAVFSACVVLADNLSQPTVQPEQEGKADMGSSKPLPASSPRFDPASEFRRAFKAAATATERRDLVMKACDDRLISSRMTLDNLKNLFGDSPMLIVYPVDKETGKQSALLCFTPPKPAPTPPYLQEPNHDWYMCFFFTHNEMAIYYLTNYGK